MLGASNILLKKLDQLRIVWVVSLLKIKMSLVYLIIILVQFLLCRIFKTFLNQLGFFEGDIDTEGLLISLITPELVKKKLEILNVNKCPGLNGIHPRMLFELNFF